MRAGRRIRGMPVEEVSVFTCSPSATYSMPAHFGELEGYPRPWAYDDITVLGINYETDPDALARYVPEGFRIIRPVVAISYIMNRGVEWMAGGSYNLVAVNVPVVYLHAAERLEGSYALVVWENKTCPILGGREQAGIPKIFAQIQDHHERGDRLFTNASYEGSAFLRLDFRKTGRMSADALAALNERQGKLNWFGWRYIPNIGRPGAALSHATLYPVELAFTAGWTGEGTVRWEALTPEQHPTQAHIIRALSQLPVRAYGDCTLTRGSQVLRIDLARQLP